MAYVSSLFPLPGLYTTRIVLRRALSQVAGSMVLMTGSSLYSLATIIHMSIPVRSIMSGNTDSNRSFKSLLRISERSLSVKTFFLRSSATARFGMIKIKLSKTKNLFMMYPFM